MEDNLQSANDNLPRMISKKDVCAQTAMSRGMIDALVTVDQFPKPVKLGEKKIAFVRAEIEAWIDSRIAARGAA